MRRRRTERRSPGAAQWYQYQTGRLLCACLGCGATKRRTLLPLLLLRRLLLLAVRLMLVGLLLMQRRLLPRLPARCTASMGQCGEV